MNWLSLPISLDPRYLALLKRIAANTPPAPLKLTVTGELNGMLTFSVGLPEVPAGTDIVTQRFIVSIDGVETTNIDLPLDQASVDGLQGDDGQQVVAQLFYIDDAGNVSVPSMLTEVLVDTIAPPQPADLSLVVTGETV